ncbi:MAG TPA: DMT family transporter [Flavisolibacter sp.]|nr:DMT family transporter [Flavisolibacter sp.]
MKASTKAHIAVLGTNVFFAANYSLVKLISPSLIGPFGLNLVRVGISLVLFWTAWLFSRKNAGFQKKDIGRFVLCGISGVAVNQMFFIRGLTMTSTIHASLLILVTPLLVTLFALWVLKEQFTVPKVAGLALGICGSALLILQKESGQHAPDYLLGDAFILINSISYAIYFILVKPLMETYSTLHVIRWVFSFGFLLILPFGLGETTGAQWEAFETRHILALLGVSVTGTFLAYFFNAYGIQHLGAGITGTYIYTQPVFAVIIATFILGESFTLPKLAAALLIFAGVYLVSHKKKRPADGQ